VTIAVPTAEFAKVDGNFHQPVLIASTIPFGHRRHIRSGDKKGFGRAGMPSLLSAQPLQTVKAGLRPRSSHCRVPAARSPF
jgi:hypothetical protein